MRKQQFRKHILIAMCTSSTIWLSCKLMSALCTAHCFKSGTHQADAKQVASTKSYCVVASRRFASGTVWTKKLPVITPNRQKLTETRVHILHLHARTCLSAQKIALSVFSFTTGDCTFQCMRANCKQTGIQ